MQDAPARKGTPSQPAGSPGGALGSPRTGGSGPRKPRRTWLWILIALVVIGALLYFFLPHGGGGQTAAGGPGGGRGARGGGGAPVSVNTAKVVRSDVPIYINGLGTVTPMATVIVRPQISGQLTKIAFQEGQMVKAGQFLAEIDPRPLQQALLQAEGVLARDQANLKNGQVLLQRDQTLLAQDSIARQDVDNQEATVRSLEATIKTDQAAISAAKLNLDYTHITAPVAGRVGLRQVDVGNYITPTLTNGLVVVTEIAPIDVLFTFAEDSLPQVTARLRAGATLSATAFDRAQNNALAEGKLLTLDNLIDTTTGTVKVKARFPNGDGALFPNQFVNVRILVDTLKGAVTVPSSAVLRGANGLIVYVVKPDHTVTVRQVQAGPVAGQITSITSGLQLGETVVIDGTDRLREGARVILPGECAPAGMGGRRGRNGGGAGAGAGGAQGQRPGGGAGRRGGAGGAGCRPAQPGAPAGAPGGGPAQAGGFGGTAGQPATAAATSTASTAIQGGPVGDRQPGADPSANGGAGEGQGAPGGGGRGGGMRLLSQLGLDAGQQAKADAIMQEARQTASSTDDPDARRQAMQGAMARIMPILRPDQKAKLEALRAQQRANGGGGQGGNAGQN